MDLLWLIGFLIITIYPSAQCERSEPPPTGLIGDALNLLFGDIWSYDQFCGQNLSAEKKAQDDFVYHGFYNGTQMKSVTDLKHPEEVRRGIIELIHTGLKARYYIPLICSINSWGYADATTFQLSTRARNRQNECSSILKRALDSMRILSHPQDVLRPGDGGLNRSSISVGNESLFQDWLQLNTFGRINQGYPFDSHIWLGDYSACKRLAQTRYCFGGLQLNSWTGTETEDTDSISVRIGLCLPRQCNPRTTSDLEEITHILDKILDEYNGGLKASLLDDYHLKSVYCLPEDNSPFRNLIADWMSLIILLAGVIWMGLIVYATIFRGPLQMQQQQQHIRGRILDSFDVKGNFSKFFKTSSDSNGLVGLNMIKVVGMLWLVSSHNLQLVLPYLRNPQDLRLTSNSSPMAMIILQAQHGVVAFFLISGFLVGFKYLKKSKSSIDYRRMVVARYARLAPLYLLIYAVVKKFAHIMSSGPLWDYGVSPQSEIRQCMKESWLVPILMLADFIPPFSHCILTGWHIANDFHIYLLIPLLLKIYQRSRRNGRLVAIASFTLSHLFHFWNFHHSNNFNFETFVREPFTIGSRTLMERLANDYVNPIGRFGTYFLGVLLADIIVEFRATRNINRNVVDKNLEVTMIQLDEINSKQYKVADRESGRNFSHTELSAGVTDRILLILAVLSNIFCLVGPTMPTSMVELLGPLSKSITYPQVRLMNELSWFYILYYILKNQDSNDGRALRSHRKSSNSNLNIFSNKGNPHLLLKFTVWNVLVKLNYTLVIIHFSVARYLIQSQTQLINFSWVNLIQIVTFDTLVTYYVAFIIHLIIEVPLTCLVKEILIACKVERARRV